LSNTSKGEILKCHGILSSIITTPMAQLPDVLRELVGGVGSAVDHWGPQTV